MPESPPLNLDAQLDSVVDYLTPYWTASEQVFWRSRWYVLRQLLSAINAFSTIKLLRKLPRTSADVLSGRVSEIERTAYELGTGDAENKTEEYRVMTGDYSINQIAYNLKANFANLEMKKIKGLHDMRRKERLSLNLFRIIGLVLGAASLILKTVPKTIVEGTLRTTYDQFEAKVFWFTLIVSGYLGIVILPSWWRLQKPKRKHQFIGRILDYAVLIE